MTTNPNNRTDLRRAIRALSNESLRADRKDWSVAPDSLEHVRNALTAATVTARPSAPIIRTVHHLSCTGGTLFTKCIAAMPNTLVLNEINPYGSHRQKTNQAPSFAPTDIVSMLHQGADVADSKLTDKVFLNGVKVVLEEQSKIGTRLVLRDHSHSQFLADEPLLQDATLLDMVSDHFPTRSLVTVRHPKDTFVSLTKRQWHKHFEPSNFEEFCRRYLLFLDRHEGLPIIKYEDLVRAPKTTLRKICSILKLNYFSDFESLLHLFRFSGDSGRGGNSIVRHERRTPRAADWLNPNEHYDQLMRRLEYVPE